VIRGVLLVLRFVFILVLVRIVVRGLARAFAPRNASRPAPAPSSHPPEELVRDRICNTFVPRSRAVLAVVAGHEELFCSTACRDKALLPVPRAS
jgi:Na+-transporting methylmalonyl-CoA/oxaloacetate decarboxylase gamma subunit